MPRELWPVEPLPTPEEVLAEARVVAARERRRFLAHDLVGAPLPVLGREEFRRMAVEFVSEGWTWRLAGGVGRPRGPGPWAHRDDVPCEE